MDQQETHELYMRRCLYLARKGLGKVAPNPLVGCVIVYENRIIGEGYHREWGGAHAEVKAIRSVHDQAMLKKATLYVNLEPCPHYGKTPPCATLILEKGIPAVVTGTMDPNRMVAGKGAEILESGGTRVINGILQQECRELNRRFFTFHLEQRPYVILKWAQTRDGFIDRKRDTQDNGKINWITDESSRLLVHKWRSEEQSILTGSETVLKDNPALTLRDWPGRSPARIIIDRRGRIPPGSRVMDDSVRTIIFTDNRNEKSGNTEFIDTKGADNLLQHVLHHLYKREIQSVIVEGGRFTLSEFIIHDLWDEARVFTGNREFLAGVPAPEPDCPAATELDFPGSRLTIYRNIGRKE